MRLLSSFISFILVLSIEINNYIPPSRDRNRHSKLYIIFLFVVSFSRAVWIYTLNVKAYVC